MNEAAFRGQMRKPPCLPEGFRNLQPGRGNCPGEHCCQWGLSWLCSCCHPLTVLSKMQYLDPEGLLGEEEDDIFGEGKCLSGRNRSDLLCLASNLLSRWGILEASWWFWVSV